MSFFSIFRRKQSAPNTPMESIEEREALPDIREEDFIDNSEPAQTSISNDVEFGSKLPIDIIYSFLKEDYERKAYNDALANPDRTYKKMNLDIIKSNLEVKFKQVLLRYEDMLREIDFHIQSREQAGLTDIVELLKSKKETYLKHIEELNRMHTDLENEEPYMIGIFKSYEVGFTRGLASLSLHNLKIDSLL